MNEVEAKTEGGHINEVRTLLMDQLRALRTVESAGLEQEIRRAKAVTEVSQAIVNSARVEVDYINAVRGASESSFLQSADEMQVPRLPNKPQSPLPSADDPARLGGPPANHPWRGSVKRHRL